MLSYEERKAKFSDLTGKTLTRVEVIKDADDKIRFHVDDGTIYAMYHSQDCCESVGIDSIVGDTDSLVGTPIVFAEEASCNDREPNPLYPPKGGDVYRDDSYTWTFYRLRTIKGDVDIRWYGSSNGYYSERVDFEREQ